MYTYIDAMENGALKSFNDVCNLIPRYEQFSSSWIETISPIKVNIFLFHTGIFVNFLLVY